MSTEGTAEALKGTMRKEVVYRFRATQCTNRTLLRHFKFAKARSVVSSSHMSPVLLNVSLTYVVRCQYLDYMASNAQNGSEQTVQ